MLKTVLICFAVLHAAKSFPAIGQINQDAEVAKGMLTSRPPNKVWLQVKDKDKSEESRASSSASTNDGDVPIENVNEEASSKNEEDRGSLFKPSIAVPDEPTSSTEGSTSQAEGQDNRREICQYVRCAPPPSGAECIEISMQAPLLASTSLQGLDCCAVHSCRRDNGSTFIHYSIEMDSGVVGSQSLPITTTRPARLSPPRLQSPASDQYLPNLFPPSYFPLSSSVPQYPSPQQSSSSSSSYYNYNSAPMRQYSQSVPGQGSYQYPLQSPGTQNGILYPSMPQATASQNNFFPFQNNRFSYQQQLGNNRFNPFAAHNVPSQNSFVNSGIQGVGFPVETGNSLRFSRSAVASPIPNNVGHATSFSTGYTGIQMPFVSTSDYGRSRRNAIPEFGGNPGFEAQQAQAEFSQFRNN